MANNAVEGAYRGIADIAGLPVDTLLNLVDLATAGVGYAGKESGMLQNLPETTDRSNIIGSSEYIAKVAGIKPPEKTGMEAYNMARFATAGGIGGAAGGVGSALKQIIGGGLSGLTFTKAQEMYPDNPAIQMLGAMLPQVSSFVAKNTMRTATVPAYISRISPDKTATATLGEDYKANLATLQKEGLTAATRGMASGDTGALSREQRMYISPAAKNIPQAAMLKLADQSKASVGKIIDKLSGIADTTKAGKAFSNAYNAHVDSLINARKVQADIDFGAIQDKTSKQIPTNNLSATITSLINEFGVGQPVSGVVSKDLNSKITSELAALRNATGNKLSIAEAKARLEQYSKASVGKDQLFGDLNWRTQERRVAGMLSEALNKDLDVASQSGIPDAERLKIARNNYATNSGIINDYADSTIGKFFNVDKEITGTEAYKKFLGLPKEQKIDVMQKLPNDVKSALQKTAQVELMKKAEAPFSIQKGKPTWDTEQWLKGLDTMQRSGDYNILFSPEQRVALKNNIDALRMTLREGSIVSETQPLAGAAMDIARASGGAKAGYIMQGLGDFANALQGLNTETRANIMFSPLGESQIAKAIPKPTLGGVGAGLGRIQAADTTIQQPQKSLDQMTDAEISLLAEKEGFGQQPAVKSIDTMSDAEVEKLYQQEIQKDLNKGSISVPTETSMRNAIGDTMQGEQLSQEEINAQIAADAGRKPVEITIIGGQRR